MSKYLGGCIAFAAAIAAAMVAVTSPMAEDTGVAASDATTAKPATTLAGLALSRGVETLRAGKVEDAIDLLRFSVDGAARNPEALTALGDAYLAANHTDLAVASIELFERALKIEPTLIHAREGAARAAWLTGDEVRALDHLEALYFDGREVRDAYATELASRYMLAQQVDRGLRFFAKALPLAKERHAAMLLIATMLMQKGDKATARVFVERVLSEAPPNSPLVEQARHMLAAGVAEK